MVSQSPHSGPSSPTRSAPDACLTSFLIALLWLFSGEGNGNPLQSSCLENPVDRGAWWAAVYEVAQSRTQLKRLSSSSSWLFRSSHTTSSTSLLPWGHCKTLSPHCLPISNQRSPYRRGTPRPFIMLLFFLSYLSPPSTQV